LQDYDSNLATRDPEGYLLFLYDELLVDFLGDTCSIGYAKGAKVRRGLDSVCSSSPPPALSRPARSLPSILLSW
jgi:hypothetical protein